MHKTTWNWIVKCKMVFKRCLDKAFIVISGGKWQKGTRIKNRISAWPFDILTMKMGLRIGWRWGQHWMKMNIKIGWNGINIGWGWVSKLDEDGHQNWMKMGIRIGWRWDQHWMKMAIKIGWGGIRIGWNGIKIGWWVSKLDEDGIRVWMMGIKIGWRWDQSLDEDGYENWMKMGMSLSLFHVQSMLDFRATIIKFALTAK